MEFEIGDIVNLKDNEIELFEVVGVIHDSERLFLRDYAGTLQEFEVKFSDVNEQFRSIGI